MLASIPSKVGCLISSFMLLCDREVIRHLVANVRAETILLSFFLSDIRSLSCLSVYLSS